MSLHPARDELEARKRREAIELCGKNRGPHDYIPIEWMHVKEHDKMEMKRVTRFMCRVCFCNVSVATLIKQYPNVSFGKDDT